MLLPRAVRIAAAIALALVLSASAAAGWRRSGRRGAGEGGAASPLSRSSSCSSCTAIDPVNDPAYNMRSIITQSTLLEDHLANPRKRCASCCAKHFHHIMGLAEEAQSLAGARAGEYPLLADAPARYRAVYEAWLPRRADDAACRAAADALRALRRRLIDAYVLGGGGDDD